MKTAVKNAIKKVTLEMIYDVVDERTKELKDEIKQVRGDNRYEFKEIKDEMKQTREDIKSVNTRIDQVHMRLDQIMHMLTDLRR